MFTEIITQYYGIDLLATALTFVGIYLIGNKVRNGFIIAGLGNAFWAIMGLITQSVGLVIANVVIIGLYGRGYLNWRQQDSKDGSVEG